MAESQNPTISMAQSQNPTTIIESLGEEIIRIIAPVSTCMLLVVLLVTILNTSSSTSSSSSLTTIATIAYNENSSDSDWSKFVGALLNSLVFVAIVTAITFLLVLLFYFRCIRFLKIYMGFSALVVLGFMGGEVALLLIKDFRIPIDCISFLIVLLNFTVMGAISVFTSRAPILVNQGYLVVIGMLVAYWFTLLPEWTTWVLLVAMALYDLAAVLLPGGPLKLLVELAISRDEDIPALVYEARPVTDCGSAPASAPGAERRLWRGRRDSGSYLGGSSSNLNPNLTVGDLLQKDTALAIAEEGHVLGGPAAELSAPLINRRLERPDARGEEAALDESGQFEFEGIGLGSSGAIKLGLGDFIFYSVLVGRAAMYDFMTVYACYLAIIAGLGITLMLLAFYRKALPALPVSIALGVLFYFLTRIFLELFVVQVSVNLLMF
ncbi:presenilin-like protein At2g29900 [Magnolia sinica]|uniref:presenilin-like protein At2g29900 n=1 Tax=Magnolia sinica TaxID=86752 RepID=UPI00265ACC23|nr:presenilin-like protein At2g29900 [Magnolia sinica]